MCVDRLDLRLSSQPPVTILAAIGVRSKRARAILQSTHVTGSTDEALHHGTKSPHLRGQSMECLEKLLAETFNSHSFQTLVQSKDVCSLAMALNAFHDTCSVTTPGTRRAPPHTLLLCPIHVNRLHSCISWCSLKLWMQMYT